MITLSMATFDDNKFIYARGSSEIRNLNKPVQRKDGNNAFN